MRTALDFHDIQGLVLNGYRHLNHARFVLLQIADADATKRWLAHVANHIGSARRRRGEEELPGSQINLALTLSGLSKLGLPQETLEAFPREFQMGMDAPERSRRLGDVGECAPERWQFGAPTTPRIDLLLMLYARDAATLDQSTHQALSTAPSSNGVEEVFRQHSVRHDDKEPFGFRDGISQPAIEGSGQRPPGQAILKAGEFILGHVDEYGDLVSVPSVPRKLDPAGVLTPDLSHPTHSSFGRNGSYLVLRKLEQDVAGFQNFVARASRNADGSDNPERARLIAAKMVGRWPSGAPLTLAPEKDDPELGSNKHRNNNFGFAVTDRDGFACPIGSHIRRANPRDALVFPKSPARALNLSNRHRIIRRGRPYRDNAEQGILFIALNASIARQFEFIQQSWLNNPKFNGLYDEIDPLSSASTGNGMMTIQAKPLREHLPGLPRFVTMRGGAYFFMPSIRAIKFLAQLRQTPRLNQISRVIIDQG